jgi:hypothetical protein
MLDTISKENQPRTLLAKFGLNNVPVVLQEMQKKQCLKKLCIEGDKTRGMLMCKVGMLNRPATERRKNKIHYTFYAFK